MQYRFTTNTRTNVVFSLFLVALLSALVILPMHFRTNAISSSDGEKGFFPKTESHETGLKNYDIRSDKSDSTADTLLKFREQAQKPAFAVADIRREFVKGEKDLRQDVPTLKIEYNQDIRIPEVIAPDVKRGKAFLTSRSSQKRSEILRNFIKQNDSLVGINSVQADQLKVVADYTNPRGNMAFAHLEQRINGIPVFRGEVKAGFTTKGEIVRVVNNLAPGLEYDSLPIDFKDPVEAIRSAASHINYKLQNPDVIINDQSSTDLKVVFGEGDWATTAEKMYFPTEPGVARTAWRVLIWQPVNAYYVIVDAETGTMLWRKNITEDQTQSATYEVYRNANAFMDVAESPAPLSPGPVNPGLGTQGTLLTRENVSLIGNEGDLSFNNNGWITDGTNGTDGETVGNNTEAGLDIAAPDGVDATMPGTGRTFDSAWNPPPGNPAPGDVPTIPAAQRGAVIQMFYTVNLYHDSLYKLGFTEAAFNFQQDNFGRGGSGNDRVSSQGQDFAGTGNANFSTPADGFRGRMQMFRFLGPNPDRDGTTDVDVIIHELTHGTSNRLHGNATGLTSDMSRGMGEGWGDFYAHVLLSEPSDPANGVYTTGGYLLISPTTSSNFYHGIRSQPTAVMSFTGGPNNRPHNSLTFRDIDSTQAANNDAAFAPRSGPFFGSPHFRGEVWKAALWEVRTLLVERLGWQAGSEKVLQIVTDGMKLAPLGPSFLQERDAILAAASASSLAPEASADVIDVWEGFRIRGMGFSASEESTSPVRVTEAFDPPNAFIADAGFQISDASGDNDGFFEPGETLTVTIPVSNNSGQTINNVSVNIDGGTGTNYGNIADADTVTNQFEYTVPATTGCGNALTINVNISTSVGTRTETRTFVIGEPSISEIENFDSVSAPALPADWVTAQTGPGALFVTQTGTADSAPNSIFTPNQGTAGGNSGATIDSGDYIINADAGLISFRNNYDTEGGWDGGVLEISINGGGFQDIIDAGGRFIEGGYNGGLGVNSNPLDGRSAWTGNSGGYITTTAQLPAAANGQTVKFRWRFGEDTNTSSVGWNIDSVEVTTAYSCSFTPSSTNPPHDFDGDGKTDVSVFRPSLGQWWIFNSSSSSALGVSFGVASDQLVPEDFTGDGKTDVSLFRPSTNEWIILRSEDFSFFAFPFGTAGDIPAPGDFDGDGMADATVYRPSTGTWFTNRSSDGGLTVTSFGIAEDKPVVADYDGDGTDDIAVFRPSLSQWFLNRSTEGFLGATFGAAGDNTVQGDWTGDGKADIALFRPSTSQWIVLRSEDFSFFAFPFGTTGDIPSPGDYDGDGMFDATVYRPSAQTWFKQQTTNGFEAIPFGLADDIPIPNVYSVE